MLRKPHECSIVKCGSDPPFLRINSGTIVLSYHFRANIPSKMHTCMSVSNIECVLVCVYHDLMSKFRGRNFYKVGGM